MNFHNCHSISGDEMKIAARKPILMYSMNGSAPLVKMSTPPSGSISAAGA